jgi:alpha-galactosidase
MGINTAAFRLPQNGVFFTIDPDMAGITEAIPWELNRQWLDLLAQSGAATIVAPGPPARGPEQQAAIRDAFAVAAAGGTGARPVDWMETTAPESWRARSGSRSGRTYNWNGQQGASPFLGS